MTNQDNTQHNYWVTLKQGIYIPANNVWSGGLATYIGCRDYEEANDQLRLMQTDVGVDAIAVSRDTVAAVVNAAVLTDAGEGG